MSIIKALTSAAKGKSNVVDFSSLKPVTKETDKPFDFSTMKPVAKETDKPFDFSTMKPIKKIGGLLPDSLLGKYKKFSERGGDPHKDSGEPLEMLVDEWDDVLTGGQRKSLSEKHGIAVDDKDIKKREVWDGVGDPAEESSYSTADYNASDRKLMYAELQSMVKESEGKLGSRELEILQAKRKVVDLNSETLNPLYHKSISKDRLEKVLAEKGEEGYIELAKEVEAHSKKKKKWYEEAEDTNFSGLSEVVDKPKHNTTGRRYVDKVDGKVLHELEDGRIISNPENLTRNRDIDTEYPNFEWAQRNIYKGNLEEIGPDVDASTFHPYDPKGRVFKSKSWDKTFYELKDGRVIDSKDPYSSHLYFESLEEAKEHIGKDLKEVKDGKKAK